MDEDVARDLARQFREQIGYTGDVERFDLRFLEMVKVIKVGRVPSTKDDNAVRLAQLRERLSSAGDRRDWDWAESIEKELGEMEEGE
jgi:hypothetical protein